MPRIINIFHRTEQPPPPSQPTTHPRHNSQIYDYACFNTVSLNLLCSYYNREHKFNNNYISFNIENKKKIYVYNDYYNGIGSMHFLYALKIQQIPFYIYYIINNQELNSVYNLHTLVQSYYLYYIMLYQFCIIFNFFITFILMFSFNENRPLQICSSILRNN